MRGMDSKWERLADAVRAARKARKWGQEDLAREADVSLATISRLESGKGYKGRMPQTIDKVERALGWAPGSAAAILAGGDPTPLAGVSAVTGEVSAEQPATPGIELPPRIQYELQEGKILDYDVIDLPRGRGKLVVLSLHKPSRTPEDAQVEAEDVREWTRVQRRLRGLTADDEPSDS